MKADTYPRSPRVTARQKRTADYAAEWEKTRKRPSKRRVIRGPDLVCAIETMWNVTGDFRFGELLNLVIHYGFNHEFERTASWWQHELFVDPDDGYYKQVDFLRDIGKLELHTEGKKKGSRYRRQLSLHEACEHVVAESGLPGSSFEGAVLRLRRGYLKRLG
jgi:hypothetical protein